MATLYAQTTQNNYSNFNDGTVANRNYAFEFVPSATGTPTQITLDLQGVSGTPTGEVYIKADKTFASTSYGQATGLTWTSGTNTITLTSGAQINSGTKYWVYLRFTSNSSNYAQIRYDTGKTNYKMYRPSASNIDPDTLWFTFDIKTTISGDTTANGNFFLFF